jgi:hypothetical protein
MRNLTNIYFVRFIIGNEKNNEQTIVPISYYRQISVIFHFLKTTIVAK